MKLPLYLKKYNSPFKPLKLKCYFGKIAIGVPYFLPRKWIKNKEKEGYLKAVPIKFGFSSCGLGWKTKYDSYRFEYNPVWSFVAFGYQIALTFFAENADQYWESFLAYYYETNKKLNVRERLDDCIKRFPQIWSKHSGDKEETVNYWELILKDKWL
jgi:hypothetical protein